MSDVQVTHDVVRGVLNVHYTSVPSTMEAVRPHLGSTPWVVCSAVTQTAGRGTGGRPWSSPAGNVLATIAVRESFVAAALRPKLWALVGLATVAALRDICHHLPIPPRLKWPNDVIIDGKKLSGTIIESCEDYYLIGIGINVAHAPDITDGGRRATALVEHCPTGQCPDAASVLTGVVGHLYASLQTTVADDDVLARYAAEVDWSQLYCRRNPNGSRGGLVQPVSLDPFGGLMFTDVETGLPGVEHSTYFY